MQHKIYKYLSLLPVYLRHSSLSQVKTSSILCHKQQMKSTTWNAIYSHDTFNPRFTTTNDLRAIISQPSTRNMPVYRCESICPLRKTSKASPFFLLIPFTLSSSPSSSDRFIDNPRRRREHFSRLLRHRYMLGRFAPASFSRVNSKPQGSSRDVVLRGEDPRPAKENLVITR